MEPFEASGAFWLPGQQQKAARPGQLRFERGRRGIHLSLFGPLEDLAAFMPLAASHPGYPVIFGALGIGDLVTLSAAQVDDVKMSMSSSIPIQLNLRPTYVFRGAHLEHGAETEFDGFRARFEHLDEWANPGTPVVGMGLETNEGSEGGDDFVFTANMPSDVQGPAFGGTLRNTYNSMMTPERSSFTVRRASQLEFDSSAPKQVSELIKDVVVPLRYFLTFACGVPAQLTSLLMKINGLGQFVGGAWHPTWIEVGYNGWRPPSGGVAPIDLRLPLATFSSRFEQIMKGWMDLYSEQSPSMMLLFETSSAIDLPVETRFILAVEAIELYHRRRWPYGLMPRADFKRQVKSITDLVADRRLNRWLRERLANSNEPSLQHKLDALIGHAGPQTSQFLRPGFTKVATDTRNFLSHYDSKLASKAATGDDLFTLSQESIALVEFCLLRDLGFDAPTAWDLSARTPLHQELHRRGTEDQPEAR